MRRVFAAAVVVLALGAIAGAAALYVPLIPIWRDCARLGTSDWGVRDAAHKRLRESPPARLRRARRALLDGLEEELARYPMETRRVEELLRRLGEGDPAAVLAAYDRSPLAPHVYSSLLSLGRPDLIPADDCVTDLVFDPQSLGEPRVAFYVGRRRVSAFDEARRSKAATPDEAVARLGDVPLEHALAPAADDPRWESGDYRTGWQLRPGETYGYRHLGPPLRLTVAFRIEAGADGKPVRVRWRVLRAERVQ